jgi:hypothetical protein
MAAKHIFAVRNLNVLAYTNGFTLWHYRADRNNLEEVKAPGFFNAAADMMATGDMIMVSAEDGAAFVSVLPREGADDIHVSGVV